jgi:drug/metabolite transporter (DMT)-like permease
MLSSHGNLSSFKIVEPVGVGLALLSSLVWSLFWILNLRDSRDNLVKLFLSSLFSSLYIVVLAFFTGDLITVFSKPIAAAIYVGIFELGITYTFWLKALQLSETTGKISNFVYLTPFVSLIFIHFVLHETIHYTSVVGLCLIVGGIMMGRTENGHNTEGTKCR